MTDNTQRTPAVRTGGQRDEARRALSATSILSRDGPGVNPVLDAALSYAARPWPVFPCRPDKRPYTTHGVNDASTDTATIRDWWGRWPGAAIGLSCGAAGLVAVDLDVKGDADGIRAFEALGIGYDGALVSATPSGGLHLVYRAPDGCRIGNSAGKLAPGIDVRGDGGYIVAPPSVVASGEYVAVDDWSRDPGPLPGALLALLQKPTTTERPTESAPSGGNGNGKGYAAAALAAEVERMRSAHEGERNHTLYTAARNLAELAASGLLDRATIEAELLAAALTTGLPERECLATLQSGMEAGLQNPRGPEPRPTRSATRRTPDPDPEPAAVFGPVDVPNLPRAARLKVDASGAGRLLDEWLSYAKAASPSTPTLFHEAAGLWLGGLAIARRLRVVLHFGDVWPNLYALQIAPTTLYAKSTGLRLLTDLIDQALPHLRLACEFTPEALLADLAGREPTGLQDADAETRELWTAGRNLAGQRGIVLDEASALFAGLKRDYMAGTAELLLWLYDAPERRERVTRGGGLLVVRNAALSFLGATTPSSLARAEIGSAWHTGLFARFAMLTPDEPPVYSCGTERPRVPADLLSGLHRLTCELLPVPVWPDAPAVRDVALSDEARDAWQRYDKAVRFDLLAGDDPPDPRLWGCYGRLPTQALKAALILAALDWTAGVLPEPVIGLEHWTRGQAIAETWRASAHRLLAILSGDGATAEAEDRLERLVRRAGEAGVTARDLQRATGQRRDDMERLLDALRRDGLIVQKARQTRGPATMVYYWAGDGHE